MPSDGLFPDLHDFAIVCTSYSVLLVPSIWAYKIHLQYSYLYSRFMLRVRSARKGDIRALLVVYCSIFGRIEDIPKRFDACTPVPRDTHKQALGLDRRLRFALRFCGSLLLESISVLYAYHVIKRHEKISNICWLGADPSINPS